MPGSKWLPDLSDGPGVAPRLLVGPHTSQRVVDIGHRGEAGALRDVLSGKSAGIAGTVPALVVPEADRVGEFHARLALENLVAERGVSPHDEEFRLG